MRGEGNAGMPGFSSPGETGGLPGQRSGHHRGDGAGFARADGCGNFLGGRPGNAFVNLRSSFRGEAQEFEAAGFFRGVYPGEFAPGLNALVKIQGKPKMHWSVLANGGKGLKAEAGFGDVQYRSAIIAFELQEGKLIGDVSGFFAPFQVNVSQGHGSREAGYIFGRSFSGGEAKVCRIGGPRAGAGPSLWTPRSTLYSSARGMELADLTLPPRHVVQLSKTSLGRGGAGSFVRPKD